MEGSWLPYMSLIRFSVDLTDSHLGIHFRAMFVDAATITVNVACIFFVLHIEVRVLEGVASFQLPSPCAFKLLISSLLIANRQGTRTRNAVIATWTRIKLGIQIPMVAIHTNIVKLTRLIIVRALLSFWFISLISYLFLMFPEGRAKDEIRLLRGFYLPSLRQYSVRL